MAGAADSLVAGASEADGSCDAQADTQVAFVTGGVILAGDGFDLDGSPQPSTTSGFAVAITHIQAGATGGSYMNGSAPTAVLATGPITGCSGILYLETVIYEAEELQGISVTDASAALHMKAKTLSINLSYPVATANYGPAKMVGTLSGVNSTIGLATVAWNERPPR